MADSKETDLSRSISDFSCLTSATSSSIPSDVEHRVQQYTPLNKNDDTKLVLQTFLGELLDDGKEHLCEDIMGCKTDIEVNQLAASLVEGLLFSMKAPPKAPFMTLSLRIGLEDLQENIALELVTSASRNGQEQLKEQCSVVTIIDALLLVELMRRGQL